MPLTDTAIRTLKPDVKTRRYSDERGMYLEISPAGGKLWRLKYRFDGKEKRLSLGTYPDVSLRDARDTRDEARKLLAQGIDPGESKKAAKLAAKAVAGNTFEVIFREWFAKQARAKNWVPAHRDRIMSLFERAVLPYIGSRSITSIKPPELLAVIQKIEEKTVDTAHRALADCSRVFNYAIASGRATQNPAFGLRGAISPVPGGHFAATMEPTKLGEILRAIDSYGGTLTVACALRLQPLVFVRPGELRMARWADIDLDEALWSFFVTKTKTNHIVPLSTQAVAIFREVFPLTGHGTLVFPNPRSALRPMSDNAMLAAMRRMAIGKDEMTGHGFRAVARTILDEVLGFRPDIIEHQLAHTVKDPNGRAYNRTKHIEERKRMMQSWADYLDTLKVTKA